MYIQRAVQRIRRSPTPYVIISNKLNFYGEELLAQRPTHTIEDHPLSAVCDCLFNTFAATLHVVQFKHLGTRVTNQNLIQEEIKRRLNSYNVCYHSVQNCLSSRLLSKNLKIRIHKTLILPVVLYGYKTWSQVLRRVHRLRVFEKRVLRRIFGPKRD
jgi:hypothetical protein